MSLINRCAPLKKTVLTAASALCCLLGAAQAQSATVIHYWDMDTLSGGVPVDVAGGVATGADDLPNLKLNQSFLEPYAGAGNALISDLGGATSSHLIADVFDGTNATAMDFGTDDFSMSYWIYDDFTGDSDVRGPRVFDSLSGTGVGMQLATTNAGIFNLRLDDNATNFVTSAGGLPTAAPAQDAWTHVAVNVSRGTDTAEVFFNGASQGTYSVSGLTGSILPSQDMEIGAYNGGDNSAEVQSAGLDDLAFYSGLLSQQTLTDLASGAITPAQVPEPGAMAFILLGVLGGFVTRQPRK